MSSQWFDPGMNLTGPDETETLDNAIQAVNSPSFPQKGQYCESLCQPALPLLFVLLGFQTTCECHTCTLFEQVSSASALPSLLFVMRAHTFLLERWGLSILIILLLSSPTSQNLASGFLPVSYIPLMVFHSPSRAEVISLFLKIFGRNVNPSFMRL